METVETSISFQGFYQSMGLKRYPFRDRTAEKEDTGKLFIHPINYSQLQDVMENNQTAIICGNRGSGKTITLTDLKSKISDNRLVCLIDNFEDVGLEKNQLDFYSLILKNLTRTMLIYLATHKKILRKATNDEKLLLSFLIKKYGNSITDSQLKTQLESVQLSWFQKIFNKFSSPITALLNYGSTAITNFGNEILTKQFGAYLPDVSSSTIKNIFPEIQFPVENQFSSVDISYSMLDMVLSMICKLSGQIPIVFFDKLDEDVRLENDAELVACFIKDLICDNKLLLNSNLQLLISVWKIPFATLSTIFRASKHTVYYIDWNKDQLMLALNNRLAVYSDKTICDYGSLFDDDVTEEDLATIYQLSNANPRDLWSIFDSLFVAQYTINSKSKLISHDAISQGLHNFVASFQFYEYYPRKKNAQRNTNDVYSYISYLLRLRDTDEFTHEELRNKASTGGSTTNYITGMMNIGLVRKTDQKRPGGAVIYKISDPKVSYAIFNGIEIMHA